MSRFRWSCGFGTIANQVQIHWSADEPRQTETTGYDLLTREEAIALLNDLADAIHHGELVHDAPH